jgi:ATP-dependent Lhr-like helicase
MCRRIRDMLATDVEREWWSRRAREAITEARADYPWLTTDATSVLAEPNGSLSWWTFAGRSVNAALAAAVRSRIQGKVVHDNFAIKIETGSSMVDLEAFIADIRRQPIESLLPEIDADAVMALKFSDCIPRGMAETMLQRRATDQTAIATVIAEPVRFIADAD